MHNPDPNFQRTDSGFQLDPESSDPIFFTFGSGSGISKSPDPDFLKFRSGSGFFFKFGSGPGFFSSSDHIQNFLSTDPDLVFQGRIWIRILSGHAKYLAEN